MPAILILSASHIHFWVELRHPTPRQTSTSMSDLSLSPIAQPTKRARHEQCSGVGAGDGRVDDASGANGANVGASSAQAGAGGSSVSGSDGATINPSTEMEAFLEEFECSICSKLLYEPVTIPCGHTFCRCCLVRALDAKDTCALCRAVVHVDATRPLPVTHIIATALQRSFPTLYAARASEAGDYGVGTGRLPLFPLNHVVFPGQRFPLHIFEARYRLMLRRVLAGSRRFGLILGGRDIEVGCVLEITQSVPMPDGRSLIETRARERFRVLEKTEVDGYLVGRVQPHPDVLLDENSAAAANANALADRARTILDILSRAPALAVTRGKMNDAPPADASPSSLGLWLAGLLVADTADRQRLLECTDSVARLQEVATLLERYQARIGHEGTSSVDGCHRECVLM